MAEAGRGDLAEPGAGGERLRDPVAGMTVRPVERRDREDWDRLWGGYLDFYQANVAPQIFDITFTRLLDPDPSTFRGLVAEVEGRPRGLVHFVFHPHCWRLEPVCYLQDLFVEPAMRGRGLAATLMAAVYAAADAHGAPQVYWMTQEFNADARKLYDRIGQATPFIKYIRT